MQSKKCAGRPVDRSKDKAIFAAAHKLLFSEGPAGFSMEKIARLAGVSKITIYSRYANRDSLIHAVLREQENLLICGLSITPENQSSTRDALVSFGDDLLTFLLGEEHLGFMRALCATPISSAEMVREIYRKGPHATIEKLAEWMERTHRAGMINSVCPEKSAELLLGMLMGGDIVRAIYGVPCQRSGPNTRHHVGWVVDAFLKVHAI